MRQFEEFIQEVKNGNLNRLRELLKNNELEVNGKVQGWTALMLASSEGHLEVVKLLLADKRVDVNEDIDGWVAAALAAAQGHLEILKLFLACERTNTGLLMYRLELGTFDRNPAVKTALITYRANPVKFRTTEKEGAIKTKSPEPMAKPAVESTPEPKLESPPRSAMTLSSEEFEADFYKPRNPPNTLDNMDDRVRQKAAESLGVSSRNLSEDELNALRAASYHDIFQTVRLAAAEALYFKGKEDDRPLLHKLVLELLEYPGLGRPHQEGANLVRAYAAQVAGSLDELDETLQAALIHAAQDSFENVRAAARFTLYQCSLHPKPKTEEISVAASLGTQIDPHRAIREANIGLLKKFLREGGDVDTPDRYGRTLLLAALLKPYEATESRFWEALTQTQDESENAEYNISLKFKTDREIIKLLLKNKANLNASTSIYDPEETSLMLKDPDYRPTSTVYESVTALHLAYLFSINFYMVDEEYRSFFEELFSEFLEDPRTNLNARFSENLTPVINRHFPIRHTLTVVYEEKNERIQRSYTSGFSLEKATLAHLLTLTNDIKNLKKLFHSGRANLNAKAFFVQNKHLLEGDTLLDNQGIEDGIETLAIAWTCRQAVPILRYAEVTPMQLAARSGFFGVVDCLLELGANPLYADSAGRDPVDYIYWRFGEIMACEDPTEEDIIPLAKLLKFLSKIKEKATLTPLPRLLLGEHDFAFTEAFLRRYRDIPGLSESLVTSELCELAELKGIHNLSETRPEFSWRVNRLRQRKALLLDRLDATRLTEDSRLSTGNSNLIRYPFIHFNNPHDGSDSFDRKLPRILHGFFKSAIFFQHPGDLVYMALPCFPEDSKRRQYHGCIYDIYSAAARFGYVLIAKRTFNKDRYPGYEHRITGKNKPSKEHVKSMVEYVFMRSELKFLEILEHPKYGPEKVCFSLQEYERKSSKSAPPPPESIPKYYLVLQNLSVDDSNPMALQKFYTTVDPVDIPRSTSSTAVSPRSVRGLTFFREHPFITKRVTKPFDSLSITELNELLFKSAYEGDASMVELLLESGADINSQHTDPRNGYKGKTALFIASEMGHSDVVDVLLRKRADANVLDQGGWGPLQVAQYMFKANRAGCADCMKAITEAQGIVRAKRP